LYINEHLNQSGRQFLAGELAASVIDILKKNNISPRLAKETKHQNKSYKNFSLKRLDTETKAYFVGLMLTDGYVNYTKKNIGLDLCDKDVIEFLASYINCSYSIINCQNHKTKNNFNQQTKYRIILHFEELLIQLKRFSILPQKSLSLEGPKLFKYEVKFIPYILRGIIDGDGWIRKDGKEFFICSSSEKFIITLSVIFVALIIFCKYSREYFEEK